jgi:hypothetical protein
LVLALAFVSSQAVAGTGFTYQGQLISSGTPATGGFDFQFTLFSALSGGTQVGSQVTATNITVTGGLFSTTLDFGAVAFDGTDRWVEVSVRPTGSGSYTILSPRQAITPTPYALTGLNNVLRAGDTMTGPLVLPAGGLKVGTNQVLVSPTGQLGVGTVTPSYALDVQAAGYVGINLHDTTTTTSYSQGVLGDDWYFSQAANGGGRTLMNFSAANSLLSQYATVSFEYGIKVRYLRFSASLTLDNLMHVVLLDSTSSALTMTLPPASGMQGRVMTFKHVAGANPVTVVGASGTETIDGASLVLSAANAARTIICDGTKWYVIGN